MVMDNLTHQTVASDRHVARVTTWESPDGLHYQMKVDGRLIAWGVIGPEWDEEDPTNVGQAEE